MDREHLLLATLDLGDDRRVGICTCGWASANVKGEQQARMAVRRHSVLAAHGLGSSDAA